MAGESDEQSRWGFKDKTVWNYLELLSVFLIPTVLVVAGFLFTGRQAEQDRNIEYTQAQRDQTIENQRAESDRNIEDQRAQADALQAYLDQMSELLLDESLVDSDGKRLVDSDEESEVRRLARARTLTVVERLDQDRKTLVMRFLIEARLVQGAVKTDPNEDTKDPNGDTINDFIRDLEEVPLKDPIETYFDGPIIDLALVNLSGAEVRGGYLSISNLRAADLPSADLTGADLRLADLSLADLRGAHLPKADLRRADLSGADLSCTEPPDGIRSCTDLSDADLRGAGLTDADLSGADLTDVKGITDCELKRQAKSLRGATMPNGQKYEDWHKEQECSEEENSGSS